MRDARGQAGVAAEELLHAVLVAGDDDDQIVAMVLHLLQQHLDRLLAVVTLVLRSIQVVGLVDEQHSAHCALENLPRLRRGVTDVLADQIVTRDRDQVSLSHVTQAMQDLRHP